MAPDTSFTHYEVLQVSPDASAEELRAAYKRAQRRSHPDLDGHPVLFRMVQAAWQVLSDPQARAQYDADLRGARPRGPGDAPSTRGLAAPGDGDAAHEPHLWLVDHRHWPTGLPYGRVADAPAPERLGEGGYVIAGLGSGQRSSRTVAYVRRNDGVQVLVELPPRPMPSAVLLAASPGELLLLHGHAASDGRLATVTLDGILTVHLPEVGRRVVVATGASWAPGTVLDLMTLPGGEPAWAVSLWTWDL